MDAKVESMYFSSQICGAGSLCPWRTNAHEAIPGVLAEAEHSLQKNNFEIPHRQKWLFSMFFGMENPFLASVFTHMIWIFLYRKWPFSLCNRKPKNYFPEKISHSLDFDHFLCFFGRWIRFWHLFLPITSRFCCTGSSHFSIYRRMTIFSTAKSRRNG